MVWGAIAALGGSLIGNAMQESSSKKLMAKQHHYNKEMVQNAHQWTVEDLKKAGLNPVLSASNGANVGSGVGLPSAPDYAGSAKMAIQTYFDQKRLENETDVAKATAENQKAQASKNNEESGMIKPKAEAEIKNLTSNTAVNSAKTNEIKSLIELNQTTNELNKLEKTRKRGTKEYVLGKAEKFAEEQILNSKIKKRLEELKEQIMRY